MMICLVSREYPTEDHVGGIGTYTEKTARTLAQLGHSVHVITETYGKPSQHSEDGVIMHRLAAPAIRPREARCLARARAVATAIHRLPGPPDIVQACEFGAEGVWYARQKRSTTRFITRLATPTILVEQLNRHARLAAPRTHFIDYCERMQTLNSDALLSPTDALAAIISERWRIPRHRIRTIPTGVDFAAQYRGQVLTVPPDLEGHTYIVYFGRLEERKGVHILAQALPEVLAHAPFLHVVFVGNDCPYRGESMRSFIETCVGAYRERLHFYPRLRQDKLYPILAHALFAVLPSLWENMANTCLEALDMGKPVIATLGCGFGEVIEDGRSGLLVPPGDVDLLRHALLALLDDPSRLRRMSQAARARAKHFALLTVTERLVRFYQDVRSRTFYPAVVAG